MAESPVKRKHAVENLLYLQGEKYKNDANLYTTFDKILVQ